MDRGWYFRFALVLGLVVYAWLVFWPSLEGTSASPPEWVTNTFQRRIALGLDIQGGLRLMYEVEVDQAVEDRRDLRAQQMLERLCERFEICSEDEHTTDQIEETRERVSMTSIERDGFRVTFTDASDLASLDRDLVNLFGDIVETRRTADSISFTMDNDAMQRLREQAVEQARETVSERIDGLGLREAGVMAREENVVVELPGATEEQFDQIRSVISRTARLEFKVVDDEATFLADLTDIPDGISRGQETVSAGEEHPSVQSTYLTASGEDARTRLQDYIESLVAAGTIPEGREVLVGEADLGYDEEELEEELEDGEEPEAVQEVWRTYTVHSRADVTGDAIADAMVTNDPQDGNPYVAITFDSSGADAFERLTGANVRRRMAIVLDDRVETAPVIQSRIGGGRASITLGRSGAYQTMLNEASDLVVVLRAGALPAPIRPANEQLIGPSLGADAVEEGVLGGAIGVLLVLLFMGLYYQVGGLIADFAVLLNLLFLLAILAAFEATLTLPGIAGITLTIGMAVDANVLINERIRDEMRLGKAPSTAVALGYDRAFTSIFDSQLTTFIAGVVLFQYGTGPIRGFAVTLMIGIVTSLFTSVFCTKVVFEWLVRGLRVRKLPVG
ncbi:MAG: protein translocase subunit SecD [Deltaproteobacteria bacterium]|nr:protein translocase subunit SecD [Deltaproteobacteria bacterium]